MGGGYHLGSLARLPVQSRFFCILQHPPLPAPPPHASISALTQLPEADEGDETAGGPVRGSADPSFGAAARIEAVSSSTWSWSPRGGSVERRGGVSSWSSWSDAAGDTGDEDDDDELVAASVGAYGRHIAGCPEKHGEDGKSLSSR